MSSESTAPFLLQSPLTPAQRAQYVMLGGVVLLGGAFLTLVLGWFALAPPPPLAAPWNRTVFATCALFFTLLAVWGIFLGIRAVRGYRFVSEQALRNDRALRDQGSTVGLAFVVGLSPTMFAITGGRVHSPEDTFWVGIWYFFTSGLWLLPAIVLHELGHAAAASTLGLGWFSFRVGPLEVLRAGGATRIRWQLEGMGSAWGMVRIEPSAMLAAPARMAWVALAGPAASFLCAGAHVATAYALGSTGPREAHGLAALLWGGALLHALLGLFNLLPYRLASGLQSDGALCLLMRRISKLIGRDRLLAEIQIESLSKRPRDWRASAETLLSAASEPGAHAETIGALRMLALAILLDRGDFPAARTLIAQWEPTRGALPKLVAQELRLQEAMLYALGDPPDAARARVHLGEVGPHATEPLYPRLAEAAVLLSEGQHAESRAALQQWEETSQRGGRAALWPIGNHWALDRLRAASASLPRAKA